ncbi:MAG: C-type lectin domain-containing protein [Selenomonas ruminantium]|nr:C-type lectin domain-containing protein [Selenomonas ruminantium]
MGGQVQTKMYFVYLTFKTAFKACSGEDINGIILHGWPCYGPFLLSRRKDDFMVRNLKQIILLCMLVVITAADNASASPYRLFSSTDNTLWPGMLTSVYGETSSIHWQDDYQSEHNGTVKAIAFTGNVTVTHNAGFGMTEYPATSDTIYVYSVDGSLYAECPCIPDLQAMLNTSEFRSNLQKMLQGYVPKAYNVLLGKGRVRLSREKVAAVEPAGPQGHFGNSRYAIYYTGGKLTWWEAESYCERLGGHLATITSQAEQDFIDQLNTEGYRLWIGGYRPEGLAFAWITNEPWNYTNWDDGEPNNSSNVVAKEDSVCLWNYGRWNDLSYRNHSEQSGFVCEWDN